MFFRFANLFFPSILSQILVLNSRQCSEDRQNLLFDADFVFERISDFGVDMVEAFIKYTHKNLGNHFSHSLNLSLSHIHNILQPLIFLLLFTRRLFGVAVQLTSLSPDSLFLGKEHSEELREIEEQLSHMDFSCFYGSHVGFQYSPGLARLLRYAQNIFPK